MRSGGGRIRTNSRCTTTFEDTAATPPPIKDHDPIGSMSEIERYYDNLK